MSITSRDLEGVTACFSKAGLAEGTNANTIKILAPNGAGIDFAIDGVLYHKADTDNIAMDALAAQAADTTCLYGIDIDSAGTVSMVKGTEVTTANVTAGAAVIQPPATVASKCRIGYLKIATTVAYTNGTTDLGAAGVTDTFYDVAGPMVRPLTS